MWGVSDRFLEALKYPHKIKTLVTFTDPDDNTTEVDIESGSVSVDGGQRIRRKGSLELAGNFADYELYATPGGVFRITHGLDFGSTDEQIPVFTGELVSAKQSFGADTITLSLADMGNKLARCQFVTPYTPAAAVTRVAAITAVVTTAMPDVTVLNESTDIGTVGIDQVWSSGPLDVISELTKDGGTEAFFRPDGVFVIRDLATIATPPVWTASAGDAGVLISADRVRPMDRLYNKVVVRPTSTSQTWAQQTASITDTEDPLYHTKVGDAPYPWPSPTITTEAEALGTAQRLLERVRGKTESLSLGTISNPALEANEPIRAITPQINNEPARAFQQYIDSFSLSLTSGAMRLDTRSQVTV